MLSPQNPSTLACIGFVQALQNNLSDAVETFHKALGLKKDDSFCVTMLSYVIEQFMETTSPFQGMAERFIIYSKRFKWSLFLLSKLSMLS